MLTSSTTTRTTTTLSVIVKQLLAFVALTCLVHLPDRGFVLAATNLIDCEFRNSFCYWTQSQLDDLDWAQFSRPVVRQALSMSSSQSANSSSQIRQRISSGSVYPQFLLNDIDGGSRTTVSPGGGRAGDMAIGPHNNSDYFIYIETQPDSFGKKSRLVSEWVRNATTSSHGYCFRFLYYLFNPEGLSALKVIVRNETRSEFVVWTTRDDSHSVWLTALVRINVTYNFRLILEGITGGNARDVAISHVALSEGDCYDIVEGDILVASISSLNLPDNTLNAAIANDDYLWPDGTIPYIIDDDFADSERNMLLRAFEDYGQRTCIRFQRRVDESDYIYIKKVQDALCSSSAGRQLGMQLVRLNSGCFWRYGTIVHELMHAIGFWHEQNRPDRDSYVNIIWDNILWYARENFKKLDPKFATDSGTPYDYESVMHYGASDFSKAPNLITISPRKDGSTIGQRNGLSSWDVREINRLYKCASNYDHGYGSTPMETLATSRSHSYGANTRSLSAASSNKLSGESPVLLPMSQPVVRQVALTIPTYIGGSNGLGIYPYPPIAATTTSTTTTTTTTTTTPPTTTSTTTTTTRTTTHTPITDLTVSFEQTRVRSNLVPTSSYIYSVPGAMPRLVVGSTTASTPLTAWVNITLASSNMTTNATSATCSFEQTWCGWGSDPNSDFSWDIYGPYSPNTARQRHQTMPSIDHTRNDVTGHYAYTLTGTPQKRGQRARLLSRYFSYDVNCITFWFGVNGVDAGVLRMVIINPGLEEDVIWEARGNFGDTWLSGQAPIIPKGPFFQIAFEAEAGQPTFGGTISLDDVQVSYSPKTCQLGPSDADDDFCDFEANNFCAWKNSFGDAFDWQLNRGPTPSYGTGPSFDHTYAGSGEAKGTYAFIEGSSPQKKGDKSRILKALMKNSANYCFQFWYFMYGSQMGCLRVYHSKPNHAETLLWERCGQQGAQWQNAELSIHNDEAGSHLVIEGEVGDGFQSDIAIDDLYLKTGSCPFDSKMLYCTFEVDTCTWKEDPLNKARWKKHSPGDGHESRENRDEHFYYLLGGTMMDNVWESSRLISVPVPAGTWCFVFYYRMNGWYKQPDRLAIIQSNANGEETLINSIIATPSQNGWARESVTITTTENFNIIIDSRQGKTFIGYTAIDEVSLLPGQCPTALSTDSAQSSARRRRRSATPFGL